MAANGKTRITKLYFPLATFTNMKRFQGQTIIADYTVGDQRILVLEKPAGTGAGTRTGPKRAVKKAAVAASATAAKPKPQPATSFDPPMPASREE